MKKLNVLFIFSFVIIQFDLFGQDWCGTKRDMEWIKSNDLELYNRIMASEKHTQDYIDALAIQALTSGPSPTDIIIIPVVFHVVYHTSGQNISTTQIQSQMTVLNADYRRLNADVSNTPSEFLGVAADPRIEFRMACVDPIGGATNGITTTYTDVIDFGMYDPVWNPDQDVHQDELGGKDPWDVTRYLNIWICNLDTILGGYSSYPVYNPYNETDGVVIDFQYFGTTGTATYPHALGRTMTHELGHWLDLHHIWGDIRYSCVNDDGVLDTPQQYDAYYGFPSFPQTSCGSHDMFMNYMDYTDDGCRNLFTVGQTNRMRAIFAEGGVRQNFFPQIAGSGTVSTSGTTFHALARTPTNGITWYKSDNLDYVSGQNTSDYRVKTKSTVCTNGTGWVKAVYTDLNCNPVTIQKNVQVIANLPDPNELDILNPYNTPNNTLCQGYQNQLYAAYSGSQNITDYQWDYSGWSHLEVGAKHFASYVTVPVSFSYKDIKLSAKNDVCSNYGGWRTERFYPNPHCGSFFIVFPNPANDYFQVSVIEDKLTDISEILSEGYEIRLYDYNNILVKKGESHDKSIVIDIHDLAEGLYILNIICNEQVLKMHLFIEKQ